MSTNVTFNNGIAMPARGFSVVQTPPDRLAAIDGPNTGVRGPEPAAVTLEAFQRDIPEA